MFDIIIKDGFIVNGSGNPWFIKDIGIKNKIIEKIGSLNSARTKRTVNAKGLIVAPGFIDMHSHSDLWLLKDPAAKCKIRQGITTEVIGNCGLSPAPINENRGLIKQYIEKEIGRGINDVKWNWVTMGEYLSLLGERRTAVNVAALVGHGTVRINSMGFNNRIANKKEIEEMKTLLAQTMEDGAFGLSTGLIYPPGCYSNTDELIALCRIVAYYGGIYASHIRGEAGSLIEAVKEAIKIGEKANIPLHISHHKAAWRENWGKVRETLEIIVKARKKGIDITCDLFPYVFGNGPLKHQLPSWVYVEGDNKLIQRLKDEEIRKRIKKELKGNASHWNSIRIPFVKSMENKHWEGKTLSEVGKQEKKDPLEIVFDLLIQENNVQITSLLMCEDDIRTVMKYYGTMMGTDGVPGDRGIFVTSSYGAFPRILGKYVRERVLQLEDAVRKMTSLPAQRLGLEDRGMIKENMRADITIFNPDKIMDKATIDKPRQYPDGIQYIIVNGEATIEKGKYTGILAGEVLHRH